MLWGKIQHQGRQNDERSTFLLFLSKGAGCPGHMPEGLWGQKPWDIGHVPGAKVLPWQIQRTNFVNSLHWEGRKKPWYSIVWAYERCNRQMEKVISLWLETGIGLQLVFNNQQQLIVTGCFSGASRIPQPVGRVRGDRFCWWGWGSTVL